MKALEGKKSFCTGIRPWVIQNPPQDAARAACVLLLGLCCFLPPVLAAFLGALFVLLLLASACCLPPRPCSFFGFLCPLRCLCVFWCVVCCPFFWPLVVVVGFVFVWCFWSAPPVLLLDLWAVLVASLLR